MPKVIVKMAPSAIAKAAKIDATREQEAQPWTIDRIEALYDALSEIRYACDGARGRDGVGFSRDDAELGDDLVASGPRWDSDELLRANALARKYRNTQISDALRSEIWPLEYPPQAAEPDDDAGGRGRTWDQYDDAAYGGDSDLLATREAEDRFYQHGTHDDNGDEI